MPLVIPGMDFSANSSNSSNSNRGNSEEKNAKWTKELVGKKIGESPNETTFARRDLPAEHRIVREGDMLTMDHKPDRLNVHTSEDGIVRRITHG